MQRSTACTFAAPSTCRSCSLPARASFAYGKKLAANVARTWVGGGRSMLDETRDAVGKIRSSTRAIRIRADNFRAASSHAQSTPPRRNLVGQKMVRGRVARSSPTPLPALEHCYCSLITSRKLPSPSGVCSRAMLQSLRTSSTTFNSRERAAFALRAICEAASD